MASYFYTEEPHFLDACFLCRRSLGFNSDIFMYRGNTPFCSKECREEQIEMDEAHEKSLKKKKKSISSSSDPKNSSSSASDTVRTTSTTTTLAVA